MRLYVNSNRNLGSTDPSTTTDEVFGPTTGTAVTWCKLKDVFGVVIVDDFKGLKVRGREEVYIKDSNAFEGPQDESLHGAGAAICVCRLITHVQRPAGPSINSARFCTHEQYTRTISEVIKVLQKTKKGYAVNSIDICMHTKRLIVEKGGRHASVPPVSTDPKFSLLLFYSLRTTHS